MKVQGRDRGARGTDRGARGTDRDARGSGTGPLAAWVEGEEGRRAQARILDVLRAAPEGLQEHELLRRLPARGGGNMWDLAATGDLELFRVHFVLFHLLHRLRDRLRATGEGDLEIHVLSIRLVAATGREGPATDGEELAPHDGLRAYYLDLAGGEDTGEAEVQGLVERFWEALAGLEGRDEALARLGLPAEADRVLVERRYRELVRRHHPDRGGDGGRLVEINEAMAVLRKAWT